VRVKHANRIAIEHNAMFRPYNLTLIKLDFHSPAVLSAHTWEAVTGFPLAARVCGSWVAGILCGDRAAAGGQVHSGAGVSPVVAGCVWIVRGES